SILLITLFSCSSYIPLTKMLVENNNLTPADLILLQFYSYESEIKYKGSDIKRSSEGIKEGELFKEEQIERNFLIIPMRTAGAAKEVDIDERGLPRTIHVLYDKELPTISCSLLWSSFDDQYAAYILIDNKLIINDSVYKNKTGLDSKLFTKRIYKN
ncbi:MAG: hypothetical protein PF570_05105, partial [Candidatus Cloacimonetes bacterium]|nr:hypothetical protein [Candidatus Cloacimonadota bacterium]